MPNVLLKVRLWTKVVLFTLIAVFAILFLFKNGQETAEIWYFPFVEPKSSSVLVLILVSFVLGGIIALLGRMLLFSGRQIRKLRETNRADELEKEVRNMKRVSRGGGDRS